MFRYSTTLKLRDTDAAGVAFFAAYFAIAHDAYETWISHRGETLRDWLGEVHLPIVHAHADYSAPLRLGDAFDVELTCARIGARSFTLNYRLVSPQERVLAHLETVHVAVAQHKKESKESSSVALPDKLRALLTELTPDQSQGSSQSDAQNKSEVEVSQRAQSKERR